MQEYAAEKSLDLGKLGPDAKELVLLIQANAKQHVARLQDDLQALRVPARPSPTIIPQDVVGLFSNINNEVSALQGLLQVESLVESAYWNAAGAFHDPRLSQLAAEILASQAQQWALLEALLHRGDPTKAAPFPYVRGAKTISKPHTAISS
jgi:hypothetical protein